MHEFLKGIIDWYLGALNTGGYLLIAALMAIESSIVPLPSELIIPPAAHLAHTTGRFSMAGIIIAGALGSWVGAAVMYWLSRWAGRPLVMKYGKYFLIPEAKVHKAENWARNFGSFGVFVSRLLPVVRHLIGIPMGIVKMDFRLYSVFTLIGSAIWSGVLCWIGVVAGQDEKLMKGEMHRIMIWVFGAVVILGVLYYAFVHRHMKDSGSRKD
jgi:membrane protein DedA with SNARE-associated domain